MAAPCGVSLHICRMRVTLLDDLGDVADVDDNYYVSDSLLTVGLTPNVSIGADIELRGGCDCVVASYKGVDALKRFDFEITAAKMEPGLQALMIGGTLLTGTDGTTPVDIGVGYPAPLECDDSPANLAFEFWTDHWNGDSIDPTFPYIHHLFPQSRWQIGPSTYGNEFANPTLNGYSKQNLVWDDGPYGDGVGTPTPYGAWFYTDVAAPAAECELQTVEPV